MSTQRNPAALIGGTVLIAVGVLSLLSQIFSNLNFWLFIWPFFVMGFGALFFGMFHHEPEVAERLGVPAGWRGVGTVALGHPAPDGRRPSTSARAGRPPLSDQWHRNTWAADT